MEVLWRSGGARNICSRKVGVRDARRLVAGDGAGRLAEVIWLGGREPVDILIGGDSLEPVENLVVIWGGGAEFARQHWVNAVSVRADDGDNGVDDGRGVAGVELGDSVDELWVRDSGGGVNDGGDGLFAVAGKVIEDGDRTDQVYASDEEFDVRLEDVVGLGDGGIAEVLLHADTGGGILIGAQLLDDGLPGLEGGVLGLALLDFGACLADFQLLLQDGR